MYIFFPALPHLIRLVHGNILSINKLVLEFREYWHQKTHGTTPEVLDNESNDVKVSEDKKVCIVWFRITTKFRKISLSH